MNSRMRRNAAGGGLTAALVAGVAAVTVPAIASTTPPPLAPLRAASAGSGISGHYIVVLKSGKAPAGAVGRARSRGAGVRKEFRRAVSGFSATLSASQLQAVRQDGDVAFVEPDQVVHVAATQSGAAWGLDRIDQRGLPLNGTYSATATGAGVTAYVIDTGIRTSHSQFGGRAAGGHDAVGDGNGTNDCNGHGTHVAGTIGGSTYGVAKGVNLVPVRVLDCTGFGTISQTIAGVDWVTANHRSPAVANLSLGGAASSALDVAVGNSIASGVTFVAAAGNSNANACSYSPARVAAAITVGAVSRTDSRDISYSNYGSCLDVFAPGTGITSSWHTSNTATNTISGTSMATPHVAGVAALYLETHTSATAATVASAITSTATPNVLSSVGTGSPNLLVYAGLTPPSSSGGGGGTVPSCSSPTTTYTGTFTTSGTSQYKPGSTGFTTTASGTHRGCLTGPSGSNFDLYLEKKGSGGKWTAVATSKGSTSTESITYSGTAGTYRWKIYARSNKGAYTLATVRP